MQRDHRQPSPTSISDYGKHPGVQEQGHGERYRSYYCMLPLMFI